MDLGDRIGERVELALARVSARGVDLNIGKPAPWFEDYEPHLGAPARRDVRHDELGRLADPGIPGVYSAKGRQTHSSVNRSVPRQELAFAASQMDPLEIGAVLWCGRADAFVRANLKHALLIFALEVKEVEGWPRRIRRADCEITGLVRDPDRYVLDLCTLALREGYDPDAYGSEAARATYFGVSDRHWRRSGIAAGYAAVSAKLTNWFNNGLHDLHRRLVARAA